MRRTPIKRRTPLKSVGGFGKKTYQIKRTRINPISKKRRVQNKKYATERANYLASKPLCEICTKSRSTEIHHKIGRWGERLFDATFFMAVCRDCHEQLHKNPSWAYANGYMIRR